MRSPLSGSTVIEVDVASWRRLRLSRDSNFALMSSTNPLRFRRPCRCSRKRARPRWRLAVGGDGQLTDVGRAWCRCCMMHDGPCRPCRAPSRRRRCGLWPSMQRRRCRWCWRSPRKPSTALLASSMPRCATATTQIRALARARRPPPFCTQAYSAAPVFILLETEDEFAGFILEILRRGRGDRLRRADADDGDLLAAEGLDVHTGERRD